MIKFCYLCKEESIGELLNLGEQPISNRFLAHPTDEEARFPMVVDQCPACGLVQIIDPVPAEELRPRLDWITYHEPEEHLDHLMDLVCKLPGISKDSRIAGVSFKDDPALARLSHRGFKNTWRLDPKLDLSIDSAGIGVETIQDCLTPEAAQRIVAKHGPSDFLIVRHIFEHAHDPAGFLDALKILVHERGYILFEVPDCQRALEQCDYTTLWAEHTLYFTPQTFRHSFIFSDLNLVHYGFYFYPFENSLVGIVRARKRMERTALSETILKQELRRSQIFNEMFDRRRMQIQRFFSDHRANNGKIVLLGAGHLACTFINLFRLGQLIECVVDDNPNKQGLFMPGSRLPIRGSEALSDPDVTLCLLSLNPIGEETVIKKNQSFLARGGELLSIFPSSRRALYDSQLFETKAEVCQ